MKKETIAAHVWMKSRADVANTYQNFTPAVESVEKNTPQLRPTHTVGCNRTHMAGPDIFHPRERVGRKQYHRVRHVQMTIKFIKFRQKNHIILYLVDDLYLQFNCQD